MTAARSLPPPVHAWPADAAAGVPMDLVFIEGFTGETVIGIHDSELHRPQPIRMDVTAGLPRSRACKTDEIADTIDYGVVRDRLRRLLVEHRLTLLESFAEEVANILLVEFGAHWVRVAVVKPKKFDDVDAVGVAIERRRPAAVQPPRTGGTVLSLIGAGMVPGSA